MTDAETIEALKARVRGLEEALRRSIGRDRWMMLRNGRPLTPTPNRRTRTMGDARERLNAYCVAMISPDNVERSDMEIEALIWDGSDTCLPEDIRTLLSLPQPDGWRPIESALKRPSEFVDLWAVHRIIVDGEVHTETAQRCALARWVDWSSGVWRWIDAGGNTIERDVTEEDDGHTVRDQRAVTHWMPLPDPPVSSSTGENGDG
jgi:hypothetical protein